MHAYARGCTFIGRHLKETVLYGKITWSAMGKQNLQLKSLLLEGRLALTWGCNSNPAFFFFCTKVFSWIIFPILFRVSYHQIADKKNQSELTFYVFIFEFKFRNSLGFSSPRFEKPSIGAKKVSPKTVSSWWASLLFNFRGKLLRPRLAPRLPPSPNKRNKYIKINNQQRDANNKLALT